MKNELIERLSSYVQIDTQSNDESETCPSTPGQWDLLRQLEQELHTLGLAEITLNDEGYLMATLPSNSDKDVPVIGFMAHVDTATDFTGKHVKPQLVEYNGGDILLSKEHGVVLSPKDFPELDGYHGHTLMTTDGTTLLGADNKAGIAEIMTAVHYLLDHPEVKHGKLRIAFTPDEEIGRGPHRFDVDAYGATYAYTVDGGPLGELEYETFNAAAARVICKGTNVHPGTAKGKMINATKIAMELNRRLPVDEAPEFTEGYEGFYHLQSIKGDVERTELSYIIRDFDRENFEHKKNTLTSIVHEFRQTYGEDSILLEIRDQYFNMREKIEPVMHIVDTAAQAMRNRSVEPHIIPVRGGTDGAQLSYMGLPTPNIFTGGENYHGKFEYVSVDNMVKATEVIVEIARLFEEQA
ncbi:peptidase T [Paenibacillus sp. WLX1005]|uniref:peptidase T n=1 Tax=Paenibacillus sp. WLX1005 TaxID=3243766 RepID=UPI003983EBF7